MRKMIIECDKCHKVISGNPIALNFARADRETGDYFDADDSVDDRTFELCDDCMNRLIDWITGREQAAVSEPEECPCDIAIEDLPEPEQKSSKSPEKSKGKSSASIDHAKIKALHDAGWKPKDIAGDMGLDVKQVYYSLSYHK